MPSISRLALALAAVLLLLCPHRAGAQADDGAARRTRAEALLRALHTDQVLVNATTRVQQMVDRLGQQSVGAKTDLTPEQKAAMAKAQDDAHTTVNQQLGWDAVKNDFIQAYADAFTLDELNGLVAFYESPLGQKLVEKQPGVTEKMGHVTQQKMMAVMPAIMQKIKDAAPKPAAAAPAASPSSVTPALAPAIPAVPAAPTPVASPAR